MAKKGKPYNNENRSRTLPNPSPKKNKKNPNDKAKNLEKTARFHFDFDQMNEDSLDTSFLEGRVLEKNNPPKKEKEVEKEKEKEKEKEEEIEIVKEKPLVKEEKKRKSHKEREIEEKRFQLLKKLSFSMGVICLFLLLIVFIWNKATVSKQKEEKKDETVVEEEKIVDDNYLFIGDSNTSNFDLKGVSFPYPFVKVTDSNLTTEKLINDFQNKIYLYNPSVVVLQIGIQDLVGGSRIQDSIDRYQKLIEMIQENRPNAHIYVESLYPILSEKKESHPEYRSINNATIVQYNMELKKLAESTKVTYVDLYSVLQENNQLKKDYTDDGILLNKKGYQVIWKEIKKIVDDEK